MVASTPMAARIGSHDRRVRVLARRNQGTVGLEVGDEDAHRVVDDELGGDDGEEREPERDRPPLPQRLLPLPEVATSAPSRVNAAFASSVERKRRLRVQCSSTVAWRLAPGIEVGDEPVEEVLGRGIERIRLRRGGLVGHGLGATDLVDPHDDGPGRLDGRDVSFSLRGLGGGPGSPAALRRPPPRKHRGELAHLHAGHQAGDDEREEDDATHSPSSAGSEEPVPIKAPV